MLLPVGATVRCRDGEAGKLKHVVLDPENGRVTHLIVERGILPHRQIVVPIGWVEGSSEREIVLNATLEELDMLPDYDELDFLDPELEHKPLGEYRREETKVWKSPYDSRGSRNIWLVRFERLGFHDDEVLLERGLPVVTRDEQEVGTVDHLIVDPVSHQVTHFVVRRGWLWNRKMHILPLERVLSASEAGVRLDMTLEELDQAPLYEAPATDEQIAFALQRALDTDPRTRQAGLRVEVHEGVVRFLGTMTDAVREAAQEIAWRIRGVIGFQEDLAVPAFPPLQIGTSVHAHDGEYGTLHKVVVDPHARRATHMVLHKGGLLKEDRVLPIERIERIDLDGIYLNGTAEELDQYPAYEEDVFVEPLADWPALEPYTSADTVFWGGAYVGVAPPVLPVVEFVLPAGVPENEVVLRRDADVIYKEQLVGSLDHLLFDRKGGRITYLVVEAYENGRRVFVPAEWIDELVGEAITLRHWDPGQPGVPIPETERQDADILADLKAKLRDSGLGAMHVQVDRGVVRLEGNVRTSADKANAEVIARGTPGVIAVENELITIEEMETSPKS
jgi:osmotically-inducible protein OsmY/sporulation protein YlmC with PRC-barrel domain